MTSDTGSSYGRCLWFSWCVAVWATSAATSDAAVLVHGMAVAVSSDADADSDTAASAVAARWRSVLGRLVSRHGRHG